MQAARGASLTSDEHTYPSPTDRRWRPRQLSLFAAVAVLGYLADLGTKELVLARLDPQSTVPVLGDWLSLYLTFNSGAAFSLGTSYTQVLSAIAVAAAIAVVWTVRRLRSTGWALGLGFLLAGVLGNLTDRIFRDPGPFRGHVVDFVRLPNFPIFNVADICINIAAGFIILQAIRGMRVDGTRDSDAEQAAQ